MDQKLTLYIIDVKFIHKWVSLQKKEKNNQQMIKIRDSKK